MDPYIAKLIGRAEVQREAPKNDDPRSQSLVLYKICKKGRRRTLLLVKGLLDDTQHATLHFNMALIRANNLEVLEKQEKVGSAS
ncbi:MAG TPA: hypothetical protein VI485_23090 [Vicinamibacterales bacterium]|nr:hypothetical protein [Vicinamibacterales bacterium]